MEKINEKRGDGLNVPELSFSYYFQVRNCLGNKRDYRHTNLVVNTHMDAIVGLQVVTGSNYEKIRVFVV